MQSITKQSRRMQRHLVFVWLLLLLAGCNLAPAPSKTPVPDPATPIARATPRPTEPPPVTAIAEPPAPPSALIIWAVATGPQLEALQRIIADVSTPLETQVVVIGKSPDGLYADIRANALAGLAPPDIILGTQDDLGLLQRDGTIQPASDGVGPADFLGATIESATIDGQRWGTPLAAQGFLLLLYNRRLADAPPRTTDELIGRSRAMTDGDTYGLVAGWAEPRWFVAWLTGYGGSLLTAERELSLDTPEMVQALNLLKELRPSGPPPPSTYDEGAALFKQGRVAFAIDGDWALEDYRQYTDTLELGVAPMPVVPATGRIAAPALGGLYVMYSKELSGDQLAQASAIGRALTQPEIQIRIARDLGRLPALRAVLTDPAVTGNPALAAAAAQAEGALGLPPTAALRCAWDAVAAELAPVILDEIAQADAAQLMQASATNCLATNGP